MRAARRAAIIAYVMLVSLVAIWEIRLAPATPLSRAFWVTLKVLPLLAPLPWLVRGNAYAHVLASLLLLLYFCDGVAVAYDAAKSGDFAALLYAAGEIGMVLAFVIAASLYARLSFRMKPPRAAAETES